jgi:hypothetical protein
VSVAQVMRVDEGCWRTGEVDDEVVLEPPDSLAERTS